MINQSQRESKGWNKFFATALSTKSAIFGKNVKKITLTDQNCQLLFFATVPSLRAFGHLHAANQSDKPVVNGICRLINAWELDRKEPVNSRLAGELQSFEKKLPNGWLVPLGILPFRPRYSFVRS